MRKAAAFPLTHRHKKRGTLYSVIGRACVQTDVPVRDMAGVIVYRGEKGDLWVRPVSEFEDGRFDVIAAASHSRPK